MKREREEAARNLIGVENRDLLPLANEALRALQKRAMERLLREVTELHGECTRAWRNEEIDLDALLDEEA